MVNVTEAEAAEQMAELIEKAHCGDLVVITRSDGAAVSLQAIPRRPNKPRELGTMRGSVLYMAPDLDETPEEFKDYMP